MMNTNVAMMNTNVAMMGVGYCWYDPSMISTKTITNKATNTTVGTQILMVKNEFINEKYRWVACNRFDNVMVDMRPVYNCSWVRENVDPSLIMPATQIPNESRPLLHQQHVSASQTPMDHLMTPELQITSNGSVGYSSDCSAFECSSAAVSDCMSVTEDICDSEDSTSYARSVSEDMTSDGRSETGEPGRSEEDRDYLIACPAEEGNTDKMVLKDSQGNVKYMVVKPVESKDWKPSDKKHSELEMNCLPTHEIVEEDFEEAGEKTKTVTVQPIRIMQYLKKILREYSIKKEAEARFGCKGYSTYEAIPASKLLEVDGFHEQFVDIDGKKRFNSMGVVNQLFKDENARKYMKFYQDKWAQIPLEGAFHVIDAETNEETFKNLRVLPYVVAKHYNVDRKPTFKRRSTHYRRRNGRGRSRPRMY